MPNSFVVAIVDDDDSVRKSTAGLLRHAGHRVESFTSGAEFLASDLSPKLGCILLDMRMPGMDGLAVMRALTARGDKHPVVVLTGHGEVPMAVEAMRLGAADFLEKPYAVADLLKAISRAYSRLVPRTGGDPPVSRQAVEKVARLSERQRKVLIGIMKGQPNKIIAWEFGLSVRTVETYRAQMLIKLGVRGTAEAVKMAIAAGLGVTEEGSEA